MLKLSRDWRAPAGARGRHRPSRLRSRPSLEALESRVVLYSASGNAWPSPALITLSFMPDGTNINGKASNLQATFNAKFGSTAAWENIIIKAAQTWAAQTNVNFAVVSDNGTAEGSGSNQQGDPGFGDIRIGGYNFGASTLAQAFMPPPVNNYSAAGDIQFNTGQTFNSGATYDLYTVATHEVGHALGLYHSGIASSEEYPTYNGVKGALTADDIAGIRSIYSGGQPRSADGYGNSTAGHNFAGAYNLSSLINTTSLTAVVANGNLNNPNGSDWFAFTVPQNASGTMTVQVQSRGFSLLMPELTVFDSSQRQVGVAVGVNNGDTIAVSLIGVTPGSTYYLETSSPVTTAFATGAYGLSLNFGSGPSPSIPLPATTKANGTPLSSGGGQAVKVNLETLANTTTAGNQSWNGRTRQNVGMDASGNLVEVWEGANLDDALGGVYAQRFNAAGAKVGGEFRVNTSTSAFRGVPAVAVGPSGNFAITWSSNNQDGNGLGVYAQRYDANGVAVGGEFRVNTTTAGDQTDSVPALDAAGNLVVIWSSNNQDGSGWGVYAQRYDAGGVAAGGEFRVNTTTAGDQRYSSVAAAPGGSFVITWASNNQDGNGWGIYAQRYDANGVAAGGEFRVNTTTAGDQNSPSVSVNAAGTFAITWSSNNQDGSGWGVYAQRYDAGGAAIGGEFRVNTTTANNQWFSTASLDNAGDLLITWSDSGGKAGVGNIMGQQYAPNGTPIGGEIQVNNSMGYFQQFPSMVMNNQGQVVVAWAGGSAADISGVFFQQFTISFSADSVDGFFAQGDTSDPDQAHSAPEPVVLAPAASGEGGSTFLSLRPEAVDQVLHEEGPTSRPGLHRRELRLEKPAARHHVTTRVSHVASHQHHAGKHPAALRVGDHHPKGTAAHAAGK